MRTRGWSVVVLAVVLMAITLQGTMAILTDGIVVAWDFENNVTDLTGNGNDVGYTGTTSYASEEKVTGAYSLAINTSSSYAGDDLGGGTYTEYTVCMWVYSTTEGASNNNLGGFTADGGVDSLVRTRNPDYLYSRSNGADITSATTWPANSWTFICHAAKDPSETLYMNGTIIGSWEGGGETVSTPLSAATAFRINTYPAGSNNGIIGYYDAVTVWNRNLSETEIQQVYANETAGCFYPWNCSAPPIVSTLTVELNGPVNGTTVTTLTPSVNVTAVSSTDATMNCTLWANSTNYATNTSVVNATPTLLTFSPALVNMTLYEYYVNCTDSMVSNVSETRQLTTNYTVPCVSNWSCSGYAACQLNDTQVCNAVVDVNTCGVNYTGNYSEFSPNACDYCTPSWGCDGYGSCLINDTQVCNAVNDSNGCYAQTSLPSDQYSGDYSEFSPNACDYCTPSWFCGGYGGCTEIYPFLNGTQACTVANDTYGCYAQTSLPSDQYAGNLSELSNSCVYRGAFSGSPNVTVPVVNQSERDYVNVTLGSRDTYERVNVLVGGVTVVANDTNSSTLQFLFNTSAGDRNVTVRSDDVSGSGNVSEVTVPVRVSNLGVVSSVLLDDSVYWLTGGEVPSANIVLSSASGYGAVGVVASLMSGASVLQSKNATAAVDTVYTAPGSVSQGDASGGGSCGVDDVNWQAFYATGDELTEIVTFSPYASDTYKIYEGEGTGGSVVQSGLVLSGGNGNNVLSPSVKLVKGGLYTLGASYHGNFVYRQYLSSVYPGDACYQGVQTNTVDLRLELKFADHTNLSVNFTGVANSSSNATVSVAVTDTLYNETGSSAVFVLDDLSLPSGVQPSGVTVYTASLPFNWSASSGGLGSVVYDLVWNVNGTNVSVPGVSGVNVSVSNSQETVNGRAYVRARDSYVNTTYVVNAAPFSVVLSPSLGSEVCAALTYPNEDDLPAAVNIPVNFSVFSPLGFSSPVVSVRLQLGGQVLNGTCGYVQSDSQHRNYACNVSMRYWFAADDYDLNVTYVDGVKNDSVYLSGECTYGALVASKRTTSSIGFPDAGPNIVNSPADVPVVVRNTGNVPLDLFVTGYDLSGRSSPGVKLLASRFKAGASLGSAVQLSHGVQSDVSMVVNPSQGAQASILFWLSMPADQLLQDYYAATPWQVVGSG